MAQKNKYDEEYVKKQVETYLYIMALYQSITDKVIAGIPLSRLDPNEQFIFKKFPEINRLVDGRLESLSKTLINYIKTTTREVWDLAEKKTNTTVTQEFEKRKLPVPEIKNVPKEKFEKFINRKVNGLRFSDRVWNYNSGFKNEIQEAINAALSEGKGAKEIARDLKKYLNNPDARFRRIRDKSNKLVWPKKALEYQPGRGVYRSATMNVIRLIRNETNIAYRESEWERWQKLDFIIGFQIRNSENRESTVCPICKRFNGMIFPKTFRFLGFHVQCMCTCLSVQCSEEEFERYAKGEKITPKLPEIPDEYKRYEEEQELKRNMI